MSKTKDIVVKIREMGIVDNTQDPRYATQVKALLDKGVYVYHVVDSVYVLGGTDKVRMVAYCCLFEEDSVKGTMTDLKDGCAMAYVVNPTWQIEEYGSIGFELVGGYMKRTA